MVLVMMKSAVSGHTYNACRERLADKMEHIHFDPYSKLNTLWNVPYVGILIALD